jgi:uncharacterized protein (DUF2267 family)
MGRNIFQAEVPSRMIQAVLKVVHNGMPTEQADEFCSSMESEIAVG